MVTRTSDQPPIPILLVTNELRPGGAEKCLVNLACGLNRERFQPTVVSIRSRPVGGELRLVEQLNDHGVPTIFLDADHWWSSGTAIGQLRKIIRDRHIGIVQSFLFQANVLTGLALRGLKQVRWFTGIRVADPRRLRHRLERAISSRAEKILVVSENVRRFADQTMRLPAEKLHVIPNGVEVPLVDPRFQPESLGISTPYVVFVGRLEEQKGLVQFLSNFHAVDNRLPHCDLVFVGEGNLRAKLEELAGTLERPCHFLGWQAAPQNLIAHARFLILPSLWEGLPNVLLETMALGRCLLAFAVDGVRDLVPTTDFQLVTPGNYSSFFQKMTELLTQKGLTDQLGARNRAAVDANFSLKKMIADYEAVYLSTPEPPV